MDSLVEGFRLRQATQVAVVGAGGKTTTVFHLARRLPAPVWVSASAHLGVWQLGLADRHFILASRQDLDIAVARLQKARADEAVSPAVTLFTGEIDAVKERARGVEPELLEWLHRQAAALNRALVIEADGARRKALKAPAEHEPPIPLFVDSVVVVAGLSSLGRPLSEETVYGAERFGRLSGLGQGKQLSMAAIERMLAHPSGGLKNIPAGARRLALLNQADVLDATRQTEARQAARRLLATYDAVALAALSPSRESTSAMPPEAQIHAVYEPAAAIVLAAGGARRMGAPKLLLPWRGEPVIRATARLAFESGAQQALVVTGSHAAEIERALDGLPVQIIYNPDWESGQASSLVAGLRAAAGNSGSALFLLGDQPHIPPTLPQALLRRHADARPAILAPIAGGRRANPVLFDRVAFSDLLALHGDEGGRQVMQRYPLELLPWDDERILWDLDTPDDYLRLTDFK